jgi:hypothetical protein
MKTACDMLHHAASGFQVVGAKEWEESHLRATVF